MTCVFCKILADQLPASRVHEDDNCLALMDIHPLGRGHVSVIPKRHAVQLTELRPNDGWMIVNFHFWEQEFGLVLAS
jgi:histidine triad (HIT) family protein